MINKLKKYFLFIILMFLSINTAKATTNDNIVDFTKKGTIKITLKELKEDTFVSNASITIYKLADANSKNSNLAFNYHEKLLPYEKDIKEGNITNEILKIVEGNNLSNFNKVTDDNGIVLFDNLDLGLYLVTQTNTVEGYSKLSPFLVYIPKDVDNKWTYNIDSTPKVDIIRLFDLTVEKVWNVATDIDIPNEVTIELLKENEVVDKVKLNKENNWTYTWEQIEKNDKYSVKEKNIPEGYTVTYEREDNKFIVTNTKELVQTGTNKLISPILALSGLILITVGFVIEKRKKYE